MTIIGLAGIALMVCCGAGINVFKRGKRLKGLIWIISSVAAFSVLPIKLYYGQKNVFINTVGLLLLSIGVWVFTEEGINAIKSGKTVMGMLSIVGVIAWIVAIVGKIISGF